MQPSPFPPFGKYELLAPLAKGGMAEIFLARVAGGAGQEELVVVKRLLDKLASDAEYVEMFLDEARINARLTHPNVVRVLELGKVDGKYFMAMEYVSGLSVALIGKLATKRLGHVPQEVAVGIALQAAAGLDYAHEKRLPDGAMLGIIHRDISPQNLLVSREGTVKVVDFGIAKAEGRSTTTRSGIIKGKFAYMAPEQCLGQPIDRRCDVFALGVVLFELCTSRRLFKRENSYLTYDAITSGRVPDPRDYAPMLLGEIAQITLKALSREAEDRFQTAEELRNELDRAVRAAGIDCGPAVLKAFLEETFVPELAHQSALVANATTGAPFIEPPADLVPGALTEGDPDDPTNIYQHETPAFGEPTLVEASPGEAAEPAPINEGPAPAGLALPPASEAESSATIPPTASRAPLARWSVVGLSLLLALLAAYFFIR